jgi:hypothetical protein
LANMRDMTGLSRRVKSSSAPPSRRKVLGDIKLSGSDEAIGRSARPRGANYREACSEPARPRAHRSTSFTHSLTRPRFVRSESKDCQCDTRG